MLLQYTVSRDGFDLIFLVDFFPLVLVYFYYCHYLLGSFL